MTAFSPAINAGVNPARKDVLASMWMWFPCAAFAVAWVLPYRTYPYWSFYSDYVCGIGVLVALLLLCSRSVHQSVAIPVSVFLPVGIAGWILVQALAGQLTYRADAILAIGYLAAAACASVLGANARVEDGSSPAKDTAYTAIAVALVLAACLSAFITFFQYFSLDILLGDWAVAINGDGKMPVRPFANLGQPNQLALILCWSLAALWYLFQRRFLNALTACLIAVVILASLALTQSKVAWLIAPFCVGLIAWANSRPWARRIPKSVLIGLTLYFVAFIFLLPALSALTGTPTEAVGQRMATNAIRSVMIQQGFLMGIQHPLAGVGWLGFPAHQVMIASQFGETEFAMHAHNLVAQLSAEMGWIATAIIVGASAWWFFLNFAKTPLDAKRLFALMFLIAVGLHSMVEFPLWYAYVLLPVFFVVGLVESPRSGSHRIAVPRGLVLGVVLAGAVTLAVVATDYRRVVQSFRALGMERVGWSYTEGSTEKPEWTLFPQFYDYIAFSNVRPTIGIPKEQIAAYERVARRFGYAPVLMRLATIYALNGRQDDAVAMMESMRHLYRSRYVEAYKAWQVMAGEYPEVLGKVYARLAPPA